MTTLFKNKLLASVGTQITPTAASGASSTLSGVTVTGIGGQFSCSSNTNLAVGQTVTISGTLGGVTITGYTNPTTYYIIATNGSTTFTLSTTLGGTGVVTTTGTPSGITYTLNIATITFATQSVAPFPTGILVNIVGMTPTGYNGTYYVTSGTTSTITFASTGTGSMTVAGTLSPCILTTNSSATTTAIGLSLTNITATIIVASVQLQDTVANTTAYFVQNIVIPPNTSARVINGGERLVLGASTNVMIWSNVTSSMDAVLSYVEIS